MRPQPREYNTTTATGTQHEHSLMNTTPTQPQEYNTNTASGLQHQHSPRTGNTTTATGIAGYDKRSINNLRSFLSLLTRTLT